MKKLKVRLTFFEPVLGTSPANDEIYREFIGSKAPDAASVEEEVDALGADAVVEKGMTVFPRMEDGRPFLYDYQIKGFFKDSCGGLRKVKSTESSKIKAYKKEIDKLIFPEPRQIPINFEGEITECQRPLRAQTAQGERVSLAIISLRFHCSSTRSLSEHHHRKRKGCMQILTFACSPSASRLTRLPSHS